jgi:hypothetical protein
MRKNGLTSGVWSVDGGAGWDGATSVRCVDGGACISCVIIIGFTYIITTAARLVSGSSSGRRVKHACGCGIPAITATAARFAYVITIGFTYIITTAARLVSGSSSGRRVKHACGCGIPAITATAAARLLCSYMRALYEHVETDQRNGSP